MQALGYSLAEHVIDAADLGVPQSRKRLYLVATRSQATLHLKLEQREHVPFAAVLDEDATGWRPVKSCGAGVRARVAKARRNIPRGPVLTQYVTGHPGRSVDRPIGTITTKVQWALVDGAHIRFLNARELRGVMGFPPGYQLVGNLSADTKLLGNAVCPPVATALIEKLRQVG